MIKFIFIFFFFTTNLVFAQKTIAQDTTAKALSSTEFIQVQNEYLDLCKSQLFIRHKEATREFASKFRKNIDKEVLSDEKSFSLWLSENISYTNFNSEEEAINMFLKLFSLKKKIMDENAELYLQMKKASPAQLKEILKPYFVR